MSEKRNFHTSHDLDCACFECVPAAPDAWKQYDDLLCNFTEDWDVRRDLTVTALAWDRSVRLSLVYEFGGELEIPKTYQTTRNVTTMRELANAIIAACDFVEKANPIWAIGLREPQDATEFQVGND